MKKLRNFYKNNKLFIYTIIGFYIMIYVCALMTR